MEDLSNQINRVLEKLNAQERNGITQVSIQICGAKISFINFFNQLKTLRAGGTYFTRKGKFFFFSYLPLFSPAIVVSRFCIDLDFIPVQFGFISKLFYHCIEI